MAKQVPLHRKGLFIITVLCLGCLISGLSFKVLPWQRVPRRSANAGQNSSVKNTTTTPLKGTTWEWMETRNPDDTVTKPKDSKQFVLKFTGRNFSSSTDCNGISGTYRVSDESNNDSLSFGDISSTLMFCENSQESFYTQGLREAQSYTITGDTLTLSLMSSSEMVFVAQPK